MATGINDVTHVGERTPWRVLIKSLGSGRGPGTTIATICDAKSVGGTKMYNAAGEAHFTLPNDHSAIALVVPRKVHYVVQQHDAGTALLPGGGTWHDVFTGLVIDKSATDDETVFYGMDYLGLLQTILDERFDSDNPDLPPPTGSKYVDQTISFVVQDQLARAISLTDSPVGFMVVGSIDSMPEKVSLWSTMKTTLEMCVGLIDSHRQGTGKRTRLSVKNIAGTYTIIVEDNPGVDLPNLRLGYGELVQGYEAVPFGPNWVSLVHGTGRTKEGLKVLYDTETAPTVTTAEWGRFAKAVAFLDLDDINDLKRRTKQAAYDAGQIGQKLGLAFRVNALRPLDGYDITDCVPVEIIHGGVDTRTYAPFWAILGVTWEGHEDGHTNLVLSITPRTSVSSSDSAIAGSSPYVPGGASGSVPNPDGTFADVGDQFGNHVHAISEPFVGDGTTSLFYLANECEPNTVESDWNGVQVDAVLGAFFDTITLATVPINEADIRVDYLARLV